MKYMFIQIKVSIKLSLYAMIYTNITLNPTANLRRENVAKFTFTNPWRLQEPLSRFLEFPWRQFVVFK